jgi:hypothetical protein
MNMFSDIDSAWKGKKVEFISGKHNGCSGICIGFRNYPDGAGLLFDLGDKRVMVYSRDLESIRKIID